MSTQDSVHLSPLMRKINTRLVQNWSELVKRSSVPQVERLLTHNNRVESICVNARAIFGEWAAHIRSARHSVCILVFAWEAGCDATNEIGAAFQHLAGLSAFATPPISVRILVGNQATWAHPIEQVRESMTAWRLDPRAVTLELGTLSGNVCHAQHEKTLVVDGRVMVVGGANPQGHQRYAPASLPRDAPPTDSWHDLAAALSGACARVAQQNFDFYWDQRTVAYDCRGASAPFQLLPQQTQCARLPPRPRAQILSHDNEDDIGGQGVSVLVVPQTDSSCLGVDGHAPSPLTFVCAAAMRYATRSLKIISPTLGSRLYAQSIAIAIHAGAVVQLLTSSHWSDMMHTLIGGGTLDYWLTQELLPQVCRETIDKADVRQNLYVRLYSIDGQVPAPRLPASSHAKLLCVDSQLVLVGSINFDVLSFRAGELNALIDSAATTRQLEERVFDADWARAIPVHLAWDQVVLEE
jgi:phosphatidylserine/phosphatidylglycerophosphate/cardiolipin synthase-like enzyme